MSKRLIMKRPRNRRVNCTSSAAGGRCYRGVHCMVSLGVSRCASTHCSTMVQFSECIQESPGMHMHAAGSGSLTMAAAGKALQLYCRHRAGAQVC
jgi:hypothetical protein